MRLPSRWWFTRSASIRAPFHLPLPTCALSLSRALLERVGRASCRGAERRRAKSNRIESSRAERNRAVPRAEVERSRRLATRASTASSSTPLERVCACVRARCVRLYSLRSSSRALLLNGSAFARTRVVAVAFVVKPRLVSFFNKTVDFVSSRVCAPYRFCWPRARAWTIRAQESTRI